MSDVFISYSRKDGEFMRRLHESLAAQKKDIWVDWEDIPLTADWWREICAGIEAADTFMFIISPDSINSEVCRKEIDHAVQHNKRFVPILHRELTDAERAAAHPAINAHNWIYFRAQDDFNVAVNYLMAAVETDLTHVREHTRLLIRAREWEAKGRDASLLLRGRDLLEAETWLFGSGLKEPQPTALHREYIAASRNAVSVRQRTTVGALAVGLVLALVLAAFAFIQSQAANENAHLAATAQALAENNAATAVYQGGIAQSVALAAQAQLELSGGFPERGVLLALAALENYPYTRQAESALGIAVAGSRARAIIPYGDVLMPAIAWSPDSARLVTGDEYGVMRVWDAARGEVLLEIGGTWGRIAALDWSPDGARLAAADGQTLWVLEAADGETLWQIGGLDGLNAVAWSPDGARLLTVRGSEEYQAVEQVDVWDGASREKLLSLTGHAAAWSPDGARLIVATFDPVPPGTSDTLAIFDSHTGEELLPFSGSTYALRHLAWSPDGAHIISTNWRPYGHQMRVWNAETGLSEQVLAGHTDYGAGADWSPDGARVVTASLDGTAKVWDAASGELLYTLFGHAGDLTAVAWSPDGRTIATSAEDHTLRVWNAGGNEVATLRGHTDEVFSARWSPDSTRVVTASRDGTARIWDAASGSELRNFPDASGLLWDADWSPDGMQIVVATTGAAAVILDAASGAEIVRLAGEMFRVYSAAWSPDGTRVVTSARSNHVKIWDATSGLELLTIDASSPAVWSPDGQFVATGGAGSVNVWDAASGERRLSLTGHSEYVVGIEWSPDGSRILTASRDGTAKIWDAENGALQLTLAGHTDDVNAAAWSPDGARIVTVSSDKTAKIWDAGAGVQLFSIQAHNDIVYGVSWSPDGAYIATTGYDGTAKIWPVWKSLDELVAYARACCAVRDLTPDERGQFNLPPG
ncbi:MAG: TIR domain-containing protein [Chloroflexi bacterium]|nr:TIR domain-containing protein [Chloroflexota bacterium]